MPKAEKGTPKYLANKMKAKGLQKLRWFCQMCQKQCRDENGFKCHVSSEAHQRQLLIFADAPGKFLGNFSKEFEDGFMYQLKRAHGTKRVEANRVYQEYIGDKEHVHMNATRWETLTGFIMYLGRTGKCKVDNTEKGWYITWIDREPETIARQEALAKKERLDKDDEERMAEFVKKQVERAKETAKDSNEPEYTEFVRSSEEEKLQLELKIGSAKFVKPADPPAKLSKSVFQQIPPKDKREDRKSESDRKRKKSALEEIREEEERRKKRMADERSRESMAGSSKQSHTKDDRGWMRRNIVVKIITKSLGDKYYKQKGYVKEMVDEFTSIVVMLDSGAKIKLDQDHVETVIPAEGKPVLILKGRYRGEAAILHSIDIDAFEASLKLEDGTRISLPYEHFSKIHTDS